MVTYRYYIANIISLGALLALTGCLGQNNLNTSTSSTSTTTPSPTPTIPAGAKAATFLFKQTSVAGSFAAPLANGTTPGSGVTAATGVEATIAYYPDKTTVLESGGPSGTNWPKWISSLDIGVSGTSNTSAINPDCARFSTTTTGDTATCKFSGSAGGTTSNCGAPADYFRISDIDCYNTGAEATTTRGIGSGSHTDGVYIRAVFNRDTTYLGSTENVMVVLEYAASGYSPGTSTPASLASCFSGGTANIRACADSTWEVFLKDSPTTAAGPFFLLTPPFFGYVNPTAGAANTGTGGSAISTRQFILPLAASPTVTTMQISRTGMSTTLAPAVATPAPDATFQVSCAPGGFGGGSPAANSASCLGMIFYSISFYRI